MSDPLATPLTRLLGCRVPVIQSAMGWVAEPQLVAATVEAGGFGFLGAAVMTPGEAAEKIARLKALTGRPFGVNFHMFQPGARDLVDLILANRDQVRAVSFGRGPDGTMIDRFRQAGIVCVPTVGAVRHAEKMVALGVDMLVVQGGEGGGHTGSVASSVLLPQVLDRVAIPVIAAGGFADGRGLAAALAYGAVGISMGTRFLLTRESPVPDAVKQRYLAAGTDDLEVTSAVDGMPQRMVRNKALRRLTGGGALASWRNALHAGLEMKRLTGASWRDMLDAARGMRAHGDVTLAQALRSAAAPTLLRRAIVDGDADRGLMASGQVAGRIADLPAVADLITRIESEARARIATLAGAGPAKKEAA